jgi:hypothetical protein
VQRLSARGKVTGERALDRWREMADKALGLTPATRRSYEGRIKRFLLKTRLVDRPISVASFEHVDSSVNAQDEASASTRNMRKASLDSFVHAPVWNRRQLSQTRMAARWPTRRISRAQSTNPEFNRGYTRIATDEAFPM